MGVGESLEHVNVQNQSQCWQSPDERLAIPPHHVYNAHNEQDEQREMYGKTEHAEFAPNV